MKAIGIICEYNPFHNGHVYHIKKIKKLYPDYLIILVMSTTFTQHGEVSIINKWDKTKIALNYVDLVIELPFNFATQSADIFAYGSINILNHLKVEKLVFGSELNDINLLTKLAKVTETSKYQKTLKKYLDNKLNYPRALAKTLNDLCNIKIDKPNDILGICYIKAILKLNSNIEPICIKRTNDYHDTKLTNKISSATSIRESLKNNENIKKYVPNETLKYIKNISIEDYFDYLKYKIISSDNLLEFVEVDEGIKNRLKKYILDSNSLEELINKSKTKYYTYSKIKRILIHILCDFKKEDINNNVNYIRVLGFNKNGQKYLNEIKSSLTIPLITKYNSLLNLELKVTSIYSLVFKNNDLIKQEYKNKPIIK